MNLTKWSILLVIVAALDILTTYLTMPLMNTIELNPIFRDASIVTMILAKIAAMILIIWLAWHFKQKICLITASIITFVAVVINMITFIKGVI